MDLNDELNVLSEEITKLANAVMLYGKGEIKKVYTKEEISNINGLISSIEGRVSAVSTSEEINGIDHALWNSIVAKLYTFEQILSAHCEEDSERGMAATLGSKIRHFSSMIEAKDEIIKNAAPTAHKKSAGKQKQCAAAGRDAYTDSEINDVDIAFTLGLGNKEESLELIGRMRGMFLNQKSLSAIAGAYLCEEDNDVKTAIEEMVRVTFTIDQIAEYVCSEGSSIEAAMRFIRHNPENVGYLQHINEEKQSDRLEEMISLIGAALYEKAGEGLSGAEISFREGREFNKTIETGAVPPGIDVEVNNEGEEEQVKVEDGDEEEQVKDEEEEEQVKDEEEEQVKDEEEEQVKEEEEEQVKEEEEEQVKVEDEEKEQVKVEDGDEEEQVKVEDEEEEKSGNETNWLGSVFGSDDGKGRDMENNAFEGEANGDTNRIEQEGGESPTPENDSESVREKDGNAVPEAHILNTKTTPAKIGLRGIVKYIESRCSGGDVVPDIEPAFERYVMLHGIISNKCFYEGKAVQDGTRRIAMRIIRSIASGRPAGLHSISEAAAAEDVPFVSPRNIEANWERIEGELKRANAFFSQYESKMQKKLRRTLKAAAAIALAASVGLGIGYVSRNYGAEITGGIKSAAEACEGISGDAIGKIERKLNSVRKFGKSAADKAKRIRKVL